MAPTSKLNSSIFSGSDKDFFFANLHLSALRISSPCYQLSLDFELKLLKRCSIWYISQPRIHNYSRRKRQILPAFSKLSVEYSSDAQHTLTWQLQLPCLRHVISKRNSNLGLKNTWIPRLGMKRNCPRDVMNLSTKHRSRTVRSGRSTKSSYATNSRVIGNLKKRSSFSCKCMGSFLSQSFHSEKLANI